MSSLSSSVLTAWALLAGLSLSTSTSAQESRTEPSSVSGRITVAGKPLERVVVMVTPSPTGPQRVPGYRTTTDDEGRYRITGLPPGDYGIMPFAPTLVAPSEPTLGRSGKSIVLAAGEEVEGIDFSLTKGGVITGRVTDSNGRPVVAQRVNIWRIDERGQRMPTVSFNPYMFSTDDRGDYRVYGLIPGRYKVSVGDAPNSGTVRIGFPSGAYPLTFHPDVVEESRAAIIEVKPGAETADIDIHVGRTSRTYAVTGRIIDVDTGQPMANLQYGHGALMGDQKRIGAFGWTGNRSNADGEFRIEGVGSGRYAVFVIATEQVEFYSEPAVFDVADADVSGVEIKVRRGSTISGMAVLEGNNDPDVLTRFSKLELRASVRSEELMAPSMAPINLNPDGSFRAIGLRPGKVGIYLGGYPLPKGFSLLRVERDGVEQRDGFEVGAGENVTGIRIVIGYGMGVVRGQVRIVGGQLSPEMRLRVMARKVGNEQPSGSSAVVDARGRFVIEGLMPGEYELSLSAFLIPAPGTPPPPVGRSSLPPVKQNVTVTSDAETEVTLVLDVGVKEKDG